MENPLIAIDFEKGLTLTKPEIRKFIVELEEYMKTLPQVEIPLTHYFANKGTEKAVYGRKISMDKGNLIVGKIHKFETINVVNKGSVSVICPEGGINRYNAGDVFVSSPGAKRVILCHEPSEWTTFHHSLNTEPEIIVEEFTLKDFKELENKEVLCLLSPQQ